MKERFPLPPALLRTLVAFALVVPGLASAYSPPEGAAPPEQPDVLVDLIVDGHASRPLVAGQPYRLILIGLPSEASFFITHEATLAPVASGVSDARGKAVVAGFVAPLAGKLHVTANRFSATFEAVISAPPPAVAPSMPFPPATPPSPPEEVGLDASQTIIHTEEYSYGHWLGIGEWRRVDNDGDSANRYYLTVARFYGEGTTNSNPWHLNSDWYHVADGIKADGNTFLSDFDPLDQSSSSTSGSYSIGIPAGVGYSWTTESRPTSFDYSTWDGGDATWDKKYYGNDVVFSDNSFTNRLETAAYGVIPTGHTGYAWLRLYHESKACGVCSVIYKDDAGWQEWPVSWS